MQPIIYIISAIDGDYAVLTDEKGEQNRVARMLLPESSDEGDTIVFENFQYNKKI